MASTSLQTLYLRVGAMLGTLQAAITNLQPIGPDPGRWLLSPQLQSSGEPPYWQDFWVYLPTMPTIGFRIVAEYPQFGGAVLDGLTGGVGLAAGTQFILSKPLPILTTHGVTGLMTLVQRASWDVWYEDTLDLTPAAGAYTVDLSSYKAWLTEERVCRDGQGRPLYYDPPIVTGYPQQPAHWRYGEINQQAGIPTLRLTRAYLSSLDATAPAQLCVLRPAGSLVSGAEATLGLTTDAQTIGGDPEELVQVTLLRAYEYLAVAAFLSAEERQRYAALVEPQRAWVLAHVKHYLPRDEMAGKAAA